LDGIFPGANTLLALLIAFAKMTAVVLFFMHVYWNGKLIWLTAAGSFVFLAIMFAFTIQDYATRGAGIFSK
jgi:cytochrome c oxidase subunit IV